MEFVQKKEMNASEFVGELFGVVKPEVAQEIFQNISHFGETKKNIVIDLLRANPNKYVPVLLREDE